MEGDQQRKKLPSSLLWFFSFFQIQKSPIIYLSLSFSFLCIYLYPQAQSPTYSIYLKKKREKKYRIPHVWSLIGSAQYRNVVAQGRRRKKRRRYVCFFLLLLLLLVVLLPRVRVCVCVCVCTGVVNGYHHLGFYLAFHSRSVWPSSDRSDGRNPHTL